MKTLLHSSPRRLSDVELIARVKELVCRERQATASLVAHLAELDGRKLYLAAGCASLFTYCVEVLHLSEHAAYKRIEASRVARRFPLVLERLEDGSVHLTAVRLLAPHLTSENHVDLLDRATHLSKRQVEQLIARIRPLPAVASSVRKLPGRSIALNGSSEAPSLDFTAGSGPDRSSCSTASAGTVGKNGEVVPPGNSPALTPPPRRGKVAPLSPELYKVQFTADAETFRLLEQARELLRHQVPDGDPAVVIGLALRTLVQKLAKQKFAATPTRRFDRAAASGSEPGESAGAGPPSRHIPYDVRRRVWDRDQGGCAFIGTDGRRCSERGRLEFHHVKPFASGGPATVGNIQLRCRAHNAHEAELCFGAWLPRGPDEWRDELAPERVETVAGGAGRITPAPACGDGRGGERNRLDGQLSDAVRIW